MGFTTPLTPYITSNRVSSRVDAGSRPIHFFSIMELAWGTATTAPCQVIPSQTRTINRCQDGIDCCIPYLDKVNNYVSPPLIHSIPKHLSPVLPP